MHPLLLSLHSINRWLVLFALGYTITISLRGYALNKVFTASDNLFRHATATLSHIQLLLGIFLYLTSPVVKYSFAGIESSGLISEQTFFRIIHITFMIAAVTLITIGSAKAKRVEPDKLKFKTMLIWFSAAMIIIFMIIPWPFSPLVQRPYFRSL